MTSSTPETNVDADALPKAPDSGFALDIEEKSIGDAFRGWIGKLRTGDPGALPSVLGLIVLAIIFSQVSGRFLSALNLGNLPGQGAYIAVIALGLVFVLLLGEIDLSAGTSGGVCAAFAAVAVFKGSLSDGLPGFLYWALVIGMVAAIVLAVTLKTYAGAVAVAVGLVLVLTNLTAAPRPGPDRRRLHRCGDRCLQRLVGRQGRHPELRGDPGACSWPGRACCSSP